MALRSCVRGCTTVVMVLAFVACTLKTATAQVIYGTIVGTVVDGSGAPVPGATIRVVSLGTNNVRTTFSGPAGSYSVPNLPAGAYRVVVAGIGAAATRVAPVTALTLVWDGGDA